jgi:hypothetical protein
MRRTREMVRVPLATNTVVVNFEQLAANVLDTAVDVILLDTTFWGGIRACVKAAAVCETFQLGVAVHSSGELGIQLATMLHLGAVIRRRQRHRPTFDAVRAGELRRGIRGMPGLTLRVQSALPKESAIVLGTLAELKYVAPQLRFAAALPPDAWWLTTASLNGVSYTVITAANEP